MNINISGKTRNYIFMTVLAVVALGLIAAFSMAGEQNKVHKENYINYEQALKLINSQNYAQAQTILNQLDENYRLSYQVQQGLGFCAAALGDYSEAAGYMEKARETRPALVADQEFLELYGEIFFHLGENEKARLYLQESLKYNSNPQITQKAQEILQQINSK